MIPPVPDVEAREIVLAGPPLVLGDARIPQIPCPIGASARKSAILIGLAFLRTVGVDECLICAASPVHLGVPLSVADTASQTCLEGSAALTCTSTCIAWEAVGIFSDSIGEPTSRGYHMKGQKC
jgi:hypothetical protein